MKDFLKEIRISIVATIVFAVVVCGFYPVLVWALGQSLFHSQANGSLITDNQGQIIGSKLLGQQFTLAKYFHSRPSAAGSGYDATASSGTNLGPTSQKLADAIKQNIETYRTENNLGANIPIPADAVTASGSGLDPEISLANAQLQVPRVAKARSITEDQVKNLLKQNTENRSLGIFGEAGVNVLTLNLALDQKYPVKK